MRVICEVKSVRKRKGSTISDVKTDEPVHVAIESGNDKDVVVTITHEGVVVDRVDADGDVTVTRAWEFLDLCPDENDDD